MQEKQQCAPKKKNHDTFWGYVWVFAMLALFGWCFEKVGRLILYPGDPIRDRGFLSLPFCPIYGTCVCLIGFLMGSLNAPSRFLEPVWRKTETLPAVLRFLVRFVIYFVLITLLATLVELVVGGLFKLWGIPLWNYSERWGNLWGVICPSYSLLWGLVGTVLMTVIWKPLCLLIDLIPSRTLRVVALVLFCVLLGDFLFNCTYVALTGHRFYIF